jgi:hypothetical protein
VFERSPNVPFAKIKVLTPMLTLASLCELGWVTRWNLLGGGLPVRTFYYTENWLAAASKLGRAQSRRLARTPSAQGRVLGLVEQFVAGDRRAILVRPNGNGMEPPFKRLNSPHNGVVTMRTQATRSFGFFAGFDTFVALYLEETKALKFRGRSDPYREYACKVEAFLRRLSEKEIDRTTNVESLITNSAM